MAVIWQQLSLRSRERRALPAELKTFRSLAGQVGVLRYSFLGRSGLPISKS